MHRKSIRRWRESGVLEARGHGTYVVAGSPDGPLREAWVAVLEVGEPCALVGSWALWARRLVPGMPEGQPQIGVPARRKLRRRMAARIRRITWWPSAVVDRLDEHGGLPVLSPIDSLVTAAPAVSDATLLAALQEAVFRGEVSPTELVRRRRRGLPGSARIGRVVAVYLIGHDSWLEVTAFEVLTAGDACGMHCNVVVVDERGRRLGPLDGYHEDGAGYEADGRVAHGSRRQKARDGGKDALAREMGVPLPRFIASQLGNPAAARARWLAARAQARTAGIGQRLRVEHLPGRSCPCGHIPRKDPAA